MTKSELLELIANGENSGVEFKMDDARPAQLAKEFAALANLQGGRVLIGISDDGAVAGIKRDNLEHWLMNTVFGRYIHPTIFPFYEEVQLDESKRVAVVSLSQGTSKPYVVRDRNRENIYVRLGSASRLATREQQAHLFALGGMLRADLLPVSGSKFADLSQDRLMDYFSSILKNQTFPANESEWQTQLCRLGFMTDRKYSPVVVTVAGLVLFGNSPRRLLRQAGIRWMAFKGTEKSCTALDDRVIDGASVALRQTESGAGTFVVGKGILENLFDAMRPFISEESDKLRDSIRRERLWHYPLEAIREAVINAVAHRDWTRNEEIEVIRYEDRIEILSPGNLPNTMSVEKMIAGHRSSRNQLIVDVLRDYGYVDARGMGVRTKIIPLVKNHNGTVPEFDATEDYLRVVIRRG